VLYVVGPRSVAYLRKPEHAEARFSAGWLGEPDQVPAFASMSIPEYAFRVLCVRLHKHKHTGVCLTP
jgi:hypothetical protein